MASTYTDNLRLEKQADGENPNSWGLILNQNVIDLIDDAVAGYVVVSVSSVPITLTESNGTTDQSRNASLEFAGTLTANVTITIPQKEKTYFVVENTSGAFSVIMKTAAGTGLTLTQQSNIYVTCDGTSLYSLETPTSVSAFTVNDLTVVNKASFTPAISGTSAVFSGTVSANEFDAPTGSFSTKVSTNALVVEGIASATTFIATTFGTSIQNAFGARTVSATTPSGGNDGDIWYEF